MSMHSRPSRRGESRTAAFVEQAVAQEMTQAALQDPGRVAPQAEGDGGPGADDHDRAGYRGAEGLRRVPIVRHVVLSRWYYVHRYISVDRHLHIAVRSSTSGLYWCHFRGTAILEARSLMRPATSFA